MHLLPAPRTSRRMPTCPVRGGLFDVRRPADARLRTGGRGTRVGTPRRTAWSVLGLPADTGTRRVLRRAVLPEDACATGSGLRVRDAGRADVPDGADGRGPSRAPGRVGDALCGARRTPRRDRGDTPEPDPGRSRTHSAPRTGREGPCPCPMRVRRSAPAEHPTATRKSEESNMNVLERHRTSPWNGRAGLAGRRRRPLRSVDEPPAARGGLHRGPRVRPSGATRSAPGSVRGTP
jgi:hypothetical protein